MQKIESRLEKYPPIIEQLRAAPGINFEQIAAYKDLHVRSVDREVLARGAAPAAPEPRAAANPSEEESGD
ncbi:MAG: hypothetical protein ACOC6K_04835 [Thermodesulfobacteriota bacterium]